MSIRLLQPLVHHLSRPSTFNHFSFIFTYFYQNSQKSFFQQNPAKTDHPTRKYPYFSASSRKKQPFFSRKALFFHHPVEKIH
ncbi:MAG: hypothetical protein IJW80_06355, partial [Alistipes sp.]|nr:hypothetical protein [Alistipes sp.]